MAITSAPTPGTPHRARLTLLTHEECEQIHHASLEILERIGMVIHLPQALELLKAAGADVSDPQHVTIPPALVTRALASAPKRITIYTREGQPALALKGRNCYFGTGTETPNFIDLKTGERRTTRGADVVQAVTVADALDNIDFVACMGSVSPAEVPAHLSDRHNFARIMANTSKPILYTAWGLKGMRDIYQMALAVRNNDEHAFRQFPFIIQYAEPISPLNHPDTSLEKVIFCSQRGIPFTYASGVMLGGTVPVTAAGALALTNAEFLAGLVISQLTTEGAPVIYGGSSGPLNMKTGVGLYNGPDAYQMLSMGKEMALFYGLPDFNYGGHTDAKCIDFQAAVEAALSIYTVGLSGSNLNHDVGYLESGMTSCLQMIVLCDEVIGQTRHYREVPPINTETLALDAIAEVGSGGTFVDHPHTFTHFRQIWYSGLFDGGNYQSWQQAGAKPLETILTEKVHGILETHRPAPLAPEVARLVERILDQAT